MRQPVAVQPLQRSRLDIVEVQRGLIPVAARGMGHEQEPVPIRAPAKRTSHNIDVAADVDRRAASIAHRLELQAPYLAATAGPMLQPLANARASCRERDGQTVSTWGWALPRTTQ